MAQADSGSGGGMKNTPDSSWNAGKTRESTKKDSTGSKAQSVEGEPAASRATGNREEADRPTLLSKGERSRFRLLDGELAGGERNAAPEFHLLDKDLGGQPRARGDSVGLFEKGELDLRNEPFGIRDLRCSEWAAPGHVVVIISDSVGIDFNLAKGITTALDMIVETLVLGPVSNPLLDQIASPMKEITEYAMGEYVGGPVDKTIRALGFEPKPGRCYVFQPDMGTFTRFK